LKASFYIIFLISSIFLNAQKKQYWMIDSENSQKILVKDSAHAVKFLDSLSQNHYFFTKLLAVKSDSTKTEIIYDKGGNYNEAHVTMLPELAQQLKFREDFKTKNLDSLKRSISEKYRSQGYSFNRVKTKLTGIKKGVPQVTLSVEVDKVRKIDGFELRGYEKVPKRFVKNLEKDFKGKIYADKNILQINQSLQNHPYIFLEKPPQTLFTTDSTTIFLFTQKRKSNAFDGVLGFGNDKKDKFTLNGSINLNFRNMFNTFESIDIFWQRNPDRGQTFDLKIDIPYLFGTNIGTNVNVNIYRQDSTFANVKLIPAFYLHLNNRQKLGLRGTFETSTLMDSLYVQGKDYTKQGIGVWYEYTEPSEVELFLYRTKIRGSADFISTLYSKEDLKVSQNNIYLYAERNFKIKGNNWLNLRAETAMINSKNELATNELLRFGGWNSLRGFNENSLYADQYYYATAEYRYVIGSQAFFDVFGQYGELNNKTLSVRPKFYSFGTGFNFFLPIGLMSFQISNGNEWGNPIKLSDTKIHWGILSRF